MSKYVQLCKTEPSTSYNAYLFQHRYINIPYIWFFRVSQNLPKWGKNVAFFNLHQSIFLIVKVSYRKKYKCNLCTLVNCDLKEIPQKKQKLRSSGKLLDIQYICVYKALIPKLFLNTGVSMYTVSDGSAADQLPTKRLSYFINL